MKEVDQGPAIKVQSHQALNIFYRLKIDHVSTAVKKNRASFDGVIHTTQGSLAQPRGRNGRIKKSEFGLDGASLPKLLRILRILVHRK